MLNALFGIALLAGLFTIIVGIPFWLSERADRKAYEAFRQSQDVGSTHIIRSRHLTPTDTSKKKFRVMVICTTTNSGFVTVEADNEADALERAEKKVEDMGQTEALVACNYGVDNVHEYEVTEEATEIKG